MAEYYRVFHTPNWGMWKWSSKTSRKYGFPQLHDRNITIYIYILLPLIHEITVTTHGINNAIFTFSMWYFVPCSWKGINNLVVHIKNCFCLPLEKKKVFAFPSPASSRLRKRFRTPLWTRIALHRSISIPSCRQGVWCLENGDISREHIFLGKIVIYL